MKKGYLNERIRFVDSEGNIREDERPLIKPLLVNGEEGFGVYHSPIIVTPTGVYRPQEIKPRFFSEEVADQRDAAEIRKKQADEKVKQMFSGKEYAKLGGLTLAGAAAAGTGAAGLGYLSTLPGTVAGRFIGDVAGSMALGMGLEEGQRAAFGRSAGDIVYSQLKPYIGDFGANMARPEYIISPSMVLKNTYTQATNNLGKQYADQTVKLVKRPTGNQVSGMSATISYRDPNYKTSNLFNRFLAQQKINVTEFDKYGAMANYSRGVPEHIKSYINQNTVERAAIAMRKAGYSEREIQQYIEKVNAEMDNVKYGMYSNKDYKDAGFGDFAGFYNDDNNFISVNKESSKFAPDEVFKHEVRHLIDHRTSMTDEMYNILDDAYDKDFLEIPKHENVGSLKDYPYMDREKVTTNLDARNALFKNKNLTWVLDKNSYAEHTKPRKPRTVAELFNPLKREYPEDMIEFQNLLIQQAQPEDTVKAVESSNGYGRKYIEYLRETGKLTPEKIE